MWKFHDFSVTQILREINFGEFRRLKSAIFAILGALNFVYLVKVCLEKCKNSYKSKARASKCVEMADFETLYLPILISRKI